MAVTVHRDVVCTFCGCLCDDLLVEVEDNKISKVKNVSLIGRNKLMHAQSDHAPLKVNGREGSLEEAYDEAARILTEAKSPLIYGLSSTTSEANREAVELTEILRGVIDNPSSY